MEAECSVCGKRPGYSVNSFPGYLCKNHRLMLESYMRMHENLNDCWGYNDHQRLMLFIEENDFYSVAELGCGPGLWYRDYGSNLNISYRGYDCRMSAVQMANVINGCVMPKFLFQFFDPYVHRAPQLAEFLFSRHVLMHQEDLGRFLKVTRSLAPVVVHTATYEFGEESSRKDYGLQHKFFGEEVPNHYSNVYSLEDLKELQREIPFEIEGNWIIMR